MANIPKITLEQWAAFRYVIDEGSFAKAAESLNKSQSTISYAIARLNDSLPQPVLTIEGRKAVLTEQGKVLYRKACEILDNALSAEQIAQYMCEGWESELILVADILTPMDSLFSALNTFSKRCKHTRVKIMETSLSGTDEALLNRQGDLVITAHVPPSYLGESLTQIEMIPAAHAHHPLAHLPSISESELSQHRQIVVRDSGLKREQDSGWLAAEQRWTVSHFASSVQALRSGLGFAFIPRHHIEAQLQSGELVTLPLSFGRSRQIQLNLVKAKKEGTRPAANALAKDILTQFK